MKISEQTKNLLIGVVVIAACFMIVWIIMFLKPSVGDGKKLYHVRFSNINKITVGTQVTFAGKPVGEVIAIKEVNDARQEPVDTLRRVYFYELLLKVDSSVNIYNTDEVALQTSGLLGEKSVGIVPKAVPKGVTPILITTGTIYAESVDPIEQAFVELSELANNMDETFKSVTSWIEKNGESTASSIKSFGNAMDTAKTTLELVKGPGTFGKLINEDEVYQQMNTVMGKVNTLMDDVNNYGVLFHLNKTWQRTHKPESLTADNEQMSK